MEYAVALVDRRIYFPLEDPECWYVDGREIRDLSSVLSHYLTSSGRQDYLGTAFLVRLTLEQIKEKQNPIQKKKREGQRKMVRVIALKGKVNSKSPGK